MIPEQDPFAHPPGADVLRAALLDAPPFIDAADAAAVLEAALDAVRHDLVLMEPPRVTLEGISRHLGGAFPPPDAGAGPALPTPTHPLPNPADFVAMLLHGE